MQIGVLESTTRKLCWQLLVGENKDYTWVQDTKLAKNFDLFIDLDFDSNSQRLHDYAGNTTTVFLLSATDCTIEKAFLETQIAYHGEKCYGINAIPTFLERKTLEACNPFKLPVPALPFWEKAEWVQSRVGMVTPRIVFMIINEAFYTWQEGTANREAIDTAMKLGTNYPKGPFEWCEAIGINQVYATLNALWEDTKDERYRICPALKKEWQKQQLL